VCSLVSSNCVIFCCTYTQTQSYSETEHIIDVYETIAIKPAQADLFAGNRTNPAVTTGTAFDACRPAGYEFTGIWSYSTPTNGAHTPGMYVCVGACAPC
jgi:hypothetical protein